VVLSFEINYSILQEPEKLANFKNILIVMKIYFALEAFYLCSEWFLSELTHSLRINQYGNILLPWKQRLYTQKQQVNKLQRAWSQSGRQHMMWMLTKQCLILNSITR